MNEPVRMAVVGAGVIGEEHAAAIAQLRGAELVAVCDLNAEKAQRLAEQHGVGRWGTDLRAMLAEGGIDAISVATNHGSHAPNLFDAADAGVHAIVEKPLSTKLSEATAMVDAADRAGIVFGAIFQRRFFPAAQQLKAAVAAGRIGEVTTAECLAHLGRDRAYYDSADWRGSWAAEGGGALMTQAIHMLDMLLWVVGTPVEVYGRWATLKHGDYIEVEDTAVATVEFENGALATIQAITTLDPAYGFELKVRGRSGATVGIREWPELTQAKIGDWTLDGDDPREAWETTDEVRKGFPEFHRVQLQDFVDALREGRPPAVTGSEGRDALALAKAIYLADRRRMPVRWPLTAEDVAEVEALG